MDEEQAVMKWKGTASGVRETHVQSQELTHTNARTWNKSTSLNASLDLHWQRGDYSAVHQGQQWTLNEMVMAQSIYKSIQHIVKAQ